MPLPSDYLVYANRKYGMDNDRYGWDPADRRAPVALKSGAKAMAFIVVPLEFFPLDPPAEPFKHPGAMVTPYPDLRHYTTRDYGNRVGVYRILKALADAGLKATFAVNTAVVERYAPLMSTLEDEGHEIAAHGVSTAHLHHEGLSETEERSLIAHCRKVLPDATTWMSPARNESFRTPDLLAEAGFKVCLDWEADQTRLALDTKSGSLAALPLMNELSDFKLMAVQSQQADDWADQILESASYQVAAHARYGAQCFGFTLTPYVSGQPFRIHALCRLLDGLAKMDGLDVATAGQVDVAFSDATG